ncbi:membrane protein [bacterium BFN5]|nr:membrane protein [bacterium BFN5]
MTIRSNLGTAPWDVLHLGLINYLPVTVGQVSQMTGIVVIGLSYVMGIKPGWGTIANMVFIGLFIDMFMASSWFPLPKQLAAQMAMLLGGVLIIGWGSFFYLSAAFGAGPRDSFMVGSIQKSGWPLWRVRTAIESLVTMIGYFLGGPVGVGTIVVALTLGPSIQLAFTLMNKNAQDIQHDDLLLRRLSDIESTAEKT